MFARPYICMPVKTWLDESSSDEDDLSSRPGAQAQVQRGGSAGSRAPPVGPLSGPASQPFSLSDSDSEDGSDVGQSLTSRSRTLMEDSESEDGEEDGEEGGENDAAGGYDEEKGTQGGAGHGKESARGKVVHILTDDEDGEEDEGAEDDDDDDERKESGRGATQGNGKAPRKGVSSRRRRRDKANGKSEVTFSGAVNRLPLTRTNRTNIP